MQSFESMGDGYIGCAVGVEPDWVQNSKRLASGCTCVNCHSVVSELQSLIKRREGNAMGRIEVVVRRSGL